MNLKYYIKSSVLPSVLSVLNRIGLTYDRLAKINSLNQSLLLLQSKKLGSTNAEENSDAKNIYFATILSGGLFMLCVESLIALGLKRKGHKVTFILDDNYLPIHEFKNNGNENKWDQKTELDFDFAQKFLKNLNLPLFKLSELDFTSKDEPLKNNYSDIVEASLLKHYKVGVLNDDLPLLDEKRELVKRSIMISEQVGKWLLSKKIDTVVMSHGIYSTWGPIFQVLDEANVPILMYGRGKKKHTLKFDWNKTGDSWDVSREWERVKDIELSKAQKAEIDSYLDSRISHKNDVFVYNFGEDTSDKDTVSKLGLNPDLPIYTLFTNVLWDAASAQREIAFKNPIEWVIETISWFNNHPEKQLIVKIHPAEVVIGTNMAFYDIISSRINVGNNIRIIKPHEKVNSWSIYRISELGIVHTTTAGMEMALVNKPCLVVSKTHYRAKGFTIDINSKEEYFKTLENFESNTSYDAVASRILALRYAYLLFMRYQVPFDMFYETHSTDIKGFKKTSIEEYFKDENFDHIIKCIENRKPIFVN